MHLMHAKCESVHCIARRFVIQRPVLRYCKFRMSQGDYYNERMFLIFLFFLR